MERAVDWQAYVRFVGVAGFALVVARLFRRPRRPFTAHLVFAMHYYAFELVLDLLLVVPILLTHWLSGRWPPEWIPYLPLLASAWFGFVAARHVYEQSRTRTALKTVGILLGGVLVGSLTEILALGLARLSMR
jgi:hypothetical protein